MTNQIDTGTDELLCSLDERVALITLNRPERKNALSDNLTPALRQTLFELNTNQEVGCIVITGAGNAFVPEVTYQAWGVVLILKRQRNLLPSRTG